MQASQTVLRRCMRSLPALRDKLVGAFAGFVVRIQEEHADVTKDSLALLLRWGLQHGTACSHTAGCMHVHVRCAVLVGDVASGSSA